MTQYRTPDEQRAEYEQEARIRTVLDKAVDDGAWLLVAMYLEEPADVVERWVDTFWDGMRDALDPEDRLYAIEMLLLGRVNAEAQRVMDSIEVGR